MKTKKRRQKDLDKRTKELGIESFVNDIPLSEVPSVIKEIECSFGVKLPEDYAWFLLEYGSFCFLEDVEYPGRNICIGSFLCEDMIEWLSVIDERFPTQFIPIADDGGGNLLGMSLRQDETHGQIYWHHHCVGAVDDTDAARFEVLDWIAPSWADFIMGLEIT